MIARQLTDPLTVRTHFEGPPVAACFQCDQITSIRHIGWHPELSARGQVVALLPYCDRCLRRRECQQVLEQLQADQ